MDFIQKIQTRIKDENIFNVSLFEKLLLTDKKYVIGRNNESLKIINSINIDGIIDDFYSEQKWNNIDVLGFDQIDKKSLIINCSTSISPNSVLKKIESLGFFNVINYCEFVSKDLKYYSPDFTVSMIQGLNNNIISITNIYERLSDIISKKTFEDLILYRITCNPKFTIDYNLSVDEQYFENFMNYKNEIFVDAGGFNGDTSEMFINKKKIIKKVFFIEPSGFNLQQAKLRLNNFTNIHYFNLGLSDKSEFLYFNECNNTSSNFSDEGDVEIQVKRLDEIVSEEITFIKMDIEGFELKALKGAESIIRKYKPKLAIAVYHNSSDFFEIPNFILSMNPNYKLYLRHYTEGWSETVMYFI